MSNPHDGDGPVPNVLIVEDDELVGETMLAMLDDAAQATLVNDTATALETLESADRIDVLILDCLLPGGGVARLLEVADARQVPVIMTSGSSAEIGRIGGSRPALPKPFSADSMIALVRRTAGAGKQRA